MTALLLGGGTQNYLFSDLAVQTLAAVFLVIALSDLHWSDLDPATRQILGLMVLVLSIPILQSIPVPTILMQWVPGRADLFAAREAVGIPTPMFAPWSLDPHATLASLRALLPAAAMLVLGVKTGPQWRERFVWIIILAAVIMVALGVAQVAQGPESQLRFYSPTNKQDAVGLFANRNHYGSMLVIALIGAFGGVILQSSNAHRPSVRALQILGWLLLGAVLLLGVFLSRSRAAVGLASLMSLAMVMLAFKNRNQRHNTFRWLPLVVLVAGLLAAEFGLNRIADRFESFDGGQRADVIPVVIGLTQRYVGTGTGVGSFPAVYQAFEPVEILGPKIINHAHNDWAEVWIDAGFLAILVMLLFGRWYCQRLRELMTDWSRVRPENAARFVGALVILSLGLHSLVDYPLRTTSLSCVFAVACIFLLGTRPGHARTSESPANRVSTS